MVNKNLAGKELSIIIVSWNVSGFLNHCLDSVVRACSEINAEVIVVDNGSTDGTTEMVKEKYPEVNLIENADNRGFGKANNQGLTLSSGKYILYLNPDTILPRDALKLSIDYLDSNESVGLMSLKLVNADGSFQSACRRGFPTPLAAFYRMVGLSAIFPKSKRFGKYNLTFLNENETAPVDAVCGAYMLGRGELLRELKGFDELFFMYGEDIDLCWRVRKAGYEVMYHPVTEVIHFKGESSRKSRFQSAISFYNSMFIFSRKYFAEKMSFMPRILLFIGIFFNAILKAPTEWFLRYFAIPIDIFIINFTLLFFLLLKFGYHNGFYAQPDILWRISLNFTITGSYTLALLFYGAYSGKPKKLIDYFKASTVATLLFFSLAYFIPNVRFSRLAFLGTCFTLTFLIPGWRFLFSRVAFLLHTPIARLKRVLVIGHGELASKLYEKLTEDLQYKKGFVGFIKTVNEPLFVSNEMVLGNVSNLTEVVIQKKVTEIILATKDREEIDLVRLINFCCKRHINLKIVENVVGQERFFLLDVNLSENLSI